MPRKEENGTYTYTFPESDNKVVYNPDNVNSGLDIINRGQEYMDRDAEDIFKEVKKMKYSNYIPRGMSEMDEYSLRSTFCELLYRTKKLAIGIWDKNYKLDVYDIKETNNQYHLNPDSKYANCSNGLSFPRVRGIINTIGTEISEYSVRSKTSEEVADEMMKYAIFQHNTPTSIFGEEYAIDSDELDTRRFKLFKLQKIDDERVRDWDFNTYKEYLNSGLDLNTFISNKTKGISVEEEIDKTPVYTTPNQEPINRNPAKTEDKVDSERTATGTTDTGKTDTGKSDDNSSPDKEKTEPSKDTDTKDSDKTFENKPKPDNPPTISDNKGSSGVSHGGLSSNNGNGNYTFTNSGISASQDEPIEILTDEKPGDDQITSLPDDNEDIYTIPTDLSGVTSTKKHSSGGGSGVVPILGGLGAAAAVGVGAKIYMDNKKNNDNDEDSSESDDNTEDWNETSNENDGIIADEWNGDDSNFEFDDSEPNTDDDESGFSEI